MNKWQDPMKVMPGGNREREVLHRRAVHFACKDEVGQAGPQQSYLQVMLGGREYYGIPYPILDEVMRPRGLTPVPGVPAFIAGVLARRGTLMSVINLARLLGIHSDKEADQSRVVVVSAGDITIGLLVDQVESNQAYRPDELSPPLSESVATPSHYVTGIHQGYTAILDGAALIKSINGQLEDLR